MCVLRATVNNVSGVTIKKGRKSTWDTGMIVLQLSLSLD